MDCRHRTAFAAPSGRTLFVFEEGIVYVFGERGTEAAVPRADFAAFLKQCREEIFSSSDQTAVPDGLPQRRGKYLED